MADIQAFRALRYDLGRCGPLSDVVAPPYDVIDAEPTSENLARVLFDWCAANLALPSAASIAAVRVSETPATWAEYRPEPAP